MISKMKIGYNKLQQIIKEEVFNYLQQEDSMTDNISSGTDSKSLQTDIENLSLAKSKVAHLNSSAQQQLRVHITAALAILGSK